MTAQAASGAGGRLAILLATHNGARFLADQLASLEAQSWPEIDILASDDGSTDGTWATLEAFRERWTKGTVRLVRRTGEGASAVDNFRSLIVATPEDYDCVAFCDQDDVWLPHKIANCVAELTAADATGKRPLVRCSRTQLIGADGAQIGLSLYFRQPPEFRNALVQSLAGGNTMVLNRRAFNLVKAASMHTGFVAHDWWTYQVVTGAGGAMLYSPEPDTLYRQHGNNDIGANVGFLARVRRMGMLLTGRFKRWNEVNLAALEACADLLTEEARQTLHDFAQARHGPAWRRLAAFRRSGVFRQTRGGHAMLVVACVIGAI